MRTQRSLLHFSRPEITIHNEVANLESVLSPTQKASKKRKYSITNSVTSVHDLKHRTIEAPDLEEVQSKYLPSNKSNYIKTLRNGFQQSNPKIKNTEHLVNIDHLNDSKKINIGHEIDNRNPMNANPLFPLEHFDTIYIPKKTVERVVTQNDITFLNHTFSKRDRFSSISAQMVDCRIIVEKDDLTSSQRVNLRENIISQHFNASKQHICGHDKVGNQYINEVYRDYTCAYIVGRLSSIEASRSIGKREVWGETGFFDEKNPIKQWYILGFCVISKHDENPKVSAECLANYKYRQVSSHHRVFRRGALLATIKLLCSNWGFGRLLLTTLETHYKARGFDGFSLRSLPHVFSFYVDKCGYQVHDRHRNKTYIPSQKNDKSVPQCIFEGDSPKNGYYLAKVFT